MDLLYIDFLGEPNIHRSRLAGIRRYAKAHGWTVHDSDDRGIRADSLPGLLARMRPIGCIAECWSDEHLLPPRLFGDIPVVYFDAPETRAWRGAASVACDNASVARAAFRELSSGLPTSYAAVSFWPSSHCRWARERIAAFRACCRAAGHPCRLFLLRPGETYEAGSERLVRWASSLPPKCAVFAVNDWAAGWTAHALESVGRSMPGSATLVGTDGSEAAHAESPDASVSSVKIDFELSGYLAARMLAERLRGAATPLPPASYGPLLVDRRESTRGRGRRDPHILRAVEIIRREACDGLGAAALAARVPGSRKHFERRFREAMGHSVLTEILDVRLDQVFALLSRRDVPIGSIAARCGFGCDYELRKLFRARTGMSLRTWRQTRFQ